MSEKNKQSKKCQTEKFIRQVSALIRFHILDELQDALLILIADTV